MNILQLVSFQLMIAISIYIQDYFIELSCVEGFSKRIIIMNRELIIREGNIFIEEQVEFHSSFTLKLCSGRQIYKIRDFEWSSACRRWQQSHLIKIPWPNSEELPLQIQVQDGPIVPQVIAEGIINLSMIAAYLHREIRIPLTYDGAFVGYLYCVVSDQQQENLQLSKNFLYMHKIQVQMLEQDSHGFKMRLLKNEQVQFKKDYHLHNLSKVLFPNLKVPVKMSDVFSIDIAHRTIMIKPIKFVIDSVRRGKTSIYEVWLRNTIKNKVGNLRIEYFIENLYLENERQMFTRKGIFVQNRIKPITAMAEQQKDKLRRSEIIRQIEEAAKRFMKLDEGIKKFIRNSKIKQNNPLYDSTPAQVRQHKSQQNYKKISKKLKQKVSLNFEITKQ